MAPAVSRGKRLFADDDASFRGRNRLYGNKGRRGREKIRHVLGPFHRDDCAWFHKFVQQEIVELIGVLEAIRVYMDELTCSFVKRVNVKCRTGNRLHYAQRSRQAFDKVSLARPEITRQGKIRGRRRQVLQNFCRHCEGLFLRMRVVFLHD